MARPAARPSTAANDELAATKAYDPRARQLLNHFPHNRSLCTKAGLLRALRAFCAAHDVRADTGDPLAGLGRAPPGSPAWVLAGGAAAEVKRRDAAKRQRTRGPPKLQTLGARASGASFGSGGGGDDEPASVPGVGTGKGPLLCARDTLRSTEIFKTPLDTIRST